jgi:hypothetical protein
MSDVLLSMDQWAKSRKRLADTFMPTINAGILSGVMRCLPHQQERTRTAPPANPAGIGSGGAVNTGAYLRSWQVTPLANGARLGNSSPYSGIIENGARPMGARARMVRGTGSATKRRTISPRMRALQRWVELRLHVPKGESRQVAFLVGRAIARRGLVGRHVLTGDDNVRVLTEIVLGEVQHEIDAALTRSYR